MIELYSGAVIALARQVLQAALQAEDDKSPYVPSPQKDVRPRVLYSPNQTMDFRLAQERWATKENAEWPTDYLPFAAVQLTAPPEPAARAQPNQPGFTVAKKLKREGIYLGAPASIVRLRYQVRYYAKSEPQLFSIIESFFLQFPRPTTTARIKVWFLEDAPITFSIEFEDHEFLREIDMSGSDQYQLYSWASNLVLECVIVGKPFTGKLMVRPVVDYSFSPGDSELDVLFEP